jgi:3'-phosphoadenosine 5'-phosphosulfate sulfotransferase (PAPS reductase)/FAD synthetase
MYKNVSKENPVIAWWSGGVTSAIACRIAIDWFEPENVRVVFIDTHNEDDDTYRFKTECEKWYGCKIESISNPDHKNIREVWFKYRTLNTASGAECSTILKRKTRITFEKGNTYSYQVFGFDINEIKRAKGMKLNNPSSRPIFPLINELLTKEDCVKKIQETNDVRLPRTYYSGYLNNNCFKTGCVQGGIGYWQKIQREDIEKFNAMAKVEHELTDLKGSPVTMLKDQSKGGGLVFLKPHPAYPGIKDISMMKGREPKPLIECNGYCGTNDLIERSATEKEINY